MGLPKSPSPTASGSTACRSASTLISASTQSLMVSSSPSASSSSSWRTTRPATYSTIWNGAPPHRVVVAHRDRAGDRNRGVLQRGDHPVLARHVVRRRRQPVQRRPAQHPFRRVVGDQEGQVGPAAGDQLATQFAAARDADLAQVAVQGDEVEPVQRNCHRTCLPPLVSREQIPYVFGAVDRRHVEVAVA